MKSKEITADRSQGELWSAGTELIRFNIANIMVADVLAMQGAPIIFTM